jgi:hypothetical protein
LSGPDLIEIDSKVQGAKEDYRDVIAWAEYPTQMRLGMENKKMSAVQEKAAAENDRRRFEDWLKAGSILNS